MPRCSPIAPSTDQPLHYHPITFVEIVWPQILKFHLAGNEVISDHQNRLPDRHSHVLLVASRRQSPILVAKAEAFRRPEQATWAAVYLNGLLSEQPRKSSERIALRQGVNMHDPQHFIGQSTWPSAPMITRHHHLIAETLCAADGVVLLDESGVVKQGHDSLGVAPHYCGAVGQGVYCTWLV
jgi:hypothetical protein